jgi:hypothetical protein
MGSTISYMVLFVLAALVILGTAANAQDIGNPNISAIQTYSKELFDHSEDVRVRMKELQEKYQDANRNISNGIAANSAARRAGDRFENAREYWRAILALKGKFDALVAQINNPNTDPWVRLETLDDLWKTFNDMEKKGKNAGYTAIQPSNLGLRRHVDYTKERAAYVQANLPKYEPPPPQPVERPAQVRVPESWGGHLVQNREKGLVDFKVIPKYEIRDWVWNRDAKGNKTSKSEPYLCSFSVKIKYLRFSDWFLSERETATGFTYTALFSQDETVPTRVTERTERFNGMITRLKSDLAGRGFTEIEIKQVTDKFSVPTDCTGESQRTVTLPPASEPVESSVCMGDDNPIHGQPRRFPTSWSAHDDWRDENTYLSPQATTEDLARFIDYWSPYLVNEI